MKTIKKQYRLCMVTESSHNDDFFITLEDKKTHNYGPDYRVEQVFDTEEECFQHALNSNEWKWNNFTILPIYRIVEEN